MLALCCQRNTFEEQMVAIMSAGQKDDGTSKSQTTAEPRPSMLRWFFYCWGLCLELLGMAFMGAVVVVFFGNVDTRMLLSLTAVAMILFYGGWFCVRQASRGSSTEAHGRR
jgi:L-asparagine transporter-like permease